MSTLGINNDVRSVFTPTMSHVLLIFVFPPSPLKTLSFSRIPPNLSQKNDDLKLIHRWIVVKFKHQVRNSIPRLLTIGNYEKMSNLREIHFAS